MPARRRLRDTPKWLLKAAHDLRRGDRARHRAANGHEPALDLTVKDDAASWAERLRGRVLPTGAAYARWRKARSRCCPALPKAPGGCRTPPPRCRARLLGDVRGM